MSFRTETPEVQALSHLGTRVDAFLVALSTRRSQIEAFVADTFAGEDISYDLDQRASQMLGHPRAVRKLGTDAALFYSLDMAAFETSEGTWDRIDDSEKPILTKLEVFAREIGV